MSTPSDKTLRLERTKLTPQPPRGGRNSTIIVAVVAGVAAAVLTGIWLNSQKQQQQVVTQAPTTQAPPVNTPVVVAAADIPEQTPITSAMVQPAQVTPDKLLPGAVVNTADIVGKLTIAPIKKGQQILSTQVAPNIQQYGSMSAMIKPGQRAMTIALDPTSSVAGYIKPGDHVDVLGTFSSGSKTITRTVLEDVMLLATGAQVLQQTPDPAANNNNNNGVLGNNNNDTNQPTPQPAAPKEVPNATVVVTPVDAEKLIMAANKGRLMLTLRSNTDNNQTTVPTVDSTAVTTLHEPGAGVASAAPPPPPPPGFGRLPSLSTTPVVAPPPPPPSVMVIKGATPTTVPVTS